MLPDPWKRWFVGVGIVYPDERTAVVLCDDAQLESWDIELARHLFVQLRRDHAGLQAVYSFPLTAYQAMKSGDADLIQVIRNHN